MVVLVLLAQRWPHEVFWSNGFGRLLEGGGEDLNPHTLIIQRLENSQDQTRKIDGAWYGMVVLNSTPTNIWI